MISATRVHEILVDCLFRDEELVDGSPEVEPVAVYGIKHNLGFHPDRIKSYEDEISDMLDQLPESFHEGTGGGMSFLSMCETKDGVQWTGLHHTMEELMLLGMGTGLMEYCLKCNSQALWAMLPGGMPYVVVKAKVATNA